MKYAKIENNIITPAELPLSLKTEIGEIIGFNNLPIAELNKHGFYELINVTPDFDSRLSYRGEPIYSFDNINNRAIVEYAIIDYSIAELKERAIDLAYAKCRATLSEYSREYNSVEISKFPFLQKEVSDFNVTGAIGYFMQETVNTGSHTAEELALSITQKMTVEKQAYQDRANAKIAIKAAISPADILPFL